MQQLVSRISVVPLHHCHPALATALPLDLGYDTRVSDLSPLLSQVNLSLWNRYVAPEAQKEINSWRICLEHRYQTTPEVGKDEQESASLLHYIVAHLRLVVPTRTNADWILQATLKNGGLDPFHFTSGVQPVFLEDCETLCAEIAQHHILSLRFWMSWIVEFRRRWRDFYPLYLSLHFSEKAYLDEDPRVRHLFRVMALEALFSSESTYGKKALLTRLAKFIGTQTDLYTPYRSALQGTLPKLIFEDVIEDICSLRNKIAHGDAIPPSWLVRDRRVGSDGQLSYSDELREGATSLVAIVWKKILQSNLQQTIADKEAMGAYMS